VLIDNAIVENQTGKALSLIVVGAGIYGLTLAERVANVLGKRVLVVEKRNHIGGNAYDEVDAQTGIEIHKYGAHIFHTSNELVWQYVNKWTEFTNYTHRVYTTHRHPSTRQKEVFPLPINLGTINQFFRSAYSPIQAREIITQQARALENPPQNLAEQGVSLIGEPLFNAFIRNYTAKQWQTPAEQLPASIIKRLPVRYNYDNRYFNDSYEGLPTQGYTAMFDQMVNSSNNIEVRLNTDYFTVKEQLRLDNPEALVVFTGPIDRYFGYKYGELRWRSLEFAQEIHNVPDFQGCPVMNYADLEEPYTRIHEFKHFYPERETYGRETSGQNDKTIIVKEFPKAWKLGDEPYYPVRTAEDLQRYDQYRALADEAFVTERVVFGGRLGEYAYYDMDNVFASALQEFEKLVELGALR
jgi:UDP-galactopyranose mutase